MKRREERGREGEGEKENRTNVWEGRVGNRRGYEGKGCKGKRKRRVGKGVKGNEGRGEGKRRGGMRSGKRQEMKGSDGD